MDALHGVLSQAGNEHDQHLAVLFTDAFGSRHAIQRLHLNVQQNQIQLLRNVLQQSAAILEQKQLHRFTSARCPALHQRGDVLSLIGLILYDRNTQLDSPPEQAIELTYYSILIEE